MNYKINHVKTLKVQIHKTIKHGKYGQATQFKRNFVKKGLVAMHGEVDISKIVTTVNVTLVPQTVSD